MPSIRQLLASVGIGMAKLKVSLDQTVHPRGSEITGTVELVGGIASQRVERITLDLCSYMAGSSTTRVLSDQVLATDVVTERRTPRSIPFTIAIPDDADLSTGNTVIGQPRYGCRLGVQAYIPFALDPRAKIPLNITIHREIKAARAAMQYMGFTEYTPPIILKKWPPTLIVSHYRPPEPLRDQLEEATLSLQASGGRIAGELRLKLHKTVLAERLKSLLAARVLVFPLEFESGDLLTAEGAPHPRGFVGRLDEILKEALVLPNNEKNRLLRAAEAPTDDVLLRAAGGAGSERPEELLRPAEEVGDA